MTGTAPDPDQLERKKVARVMRKLAAHPNRHPQTGALLLRYAALIERGSLEKNLKVLVNGVEMASTSITSATTADYTDFDPSAYEDAPAVLDLLNFSEWLDSQGLIVGDRESDDKRTHEQLAQQYLAEVG